MIKFLCVVESRPIVGVGLSRENCQRMLEGEPISIDLALQRIESTTKGVFDFNTAKLVLVAAESGEQLLDQLRDYFPASEDTVWLPIDPEESNDG